MAVRMMGRSCAQYPCEHGRSGTVHQQHHRSRRIIPSCGDANDQQDGQKSHFNFDHNKQKIISQRQLEEIIARCHGKDGFIRTVYEEKKTMEAAGLVVAMVLIEAKFAALSVSEFRLHAVTFKR